MCLVVDANCAAAVFAGTGPDEFDPVRVLLLGRKGGAKVAIGGRLVEEYRKAGVLRIVLELDRVGRAFSVDEEAVSRWAVRLKKTGRCRSNDHHIIALALVAKVRLLVSLDRALHRDFTNPALVANPRGKVYQSRRHAHLLRSHCQ